MTKKVSQEQQKHKLDGVDSASGAMLGLLKCFANPVRLMIISRLKAEHECSVNELAANLELEQPIVSRHLAEMKQCSLVRVRGHFNQRFYSLNPQTVRQVSRFLEKLGDAGAGGNGHP